jgi:hypothetical protein
LRPLAFNQGVDVPLEAAIPYENSQDLLLENLLTRGNGGQEWSKVAIMQWK